MVDEKKSQWRIIGKTVRGASHIRSNLPNQDAIHWSPESGIGSSVIMAISDGHGSNKCFRSNTGANLAVKTGASVCQNFLSCKSNLSAIKRIAEDQLPKELVRYWIEAVNSHIKENPFLTDEMETLKKKDGASALLSIEKNPLIVYGATLLVVIVSESFIVYMQLGDGDILTVSVDGHVKMPLPKDERLFANETTSLCSNNAWRDFRVIFQPIVTLPPGLILLSTDGYANSFRDVEDFLKVGSDILDMIRADGLESVNDSMETWLKEASEMGSGDDITLGVLYLEVE